jgi:hypothetical protein
VGAAWRWFLCALTFFAVACLPAALFASEATVPAYVGSANAARQVMSEALTVLPDDPILRQFEAELGP